MTTIAIITLFGAVMLLLYGIRLAGEGLQKAAGTRLKGFLLKATSNRFKALGFGALMTALLQSSSATTAMLVGLVGSGLIGLYETMGLILGADIGTTLTVQLISFRIYDWAPLLVGVGVFIILTSKGGRKKDVGLAMLGFGFVFLALKIIVDAFSPIAENIAVRDALIDISRDPLAGIIISAFFTALFQSSAATLGIAITAAHAGLLTIDGAMPIVLGANLGTSVSAILTSINAPVDAKRAAFAHVLFKILGLLLVLPFLGLFTALTGFTAHTTARQVANAHTLFNLGIALLFLPFIGPFTALVKRIIPDKGGKAGTFGPKFLDPLVLKSPTLALAQASREALRQSDIVKDMLIRSMEAFDKRDIYFIEEIEAMDDQVDTLDREIKLYIARISREGLNEEQSARDFDIMHFSDNMENIGDVIDKNLMEIARKRVRKELTFSGPGVREIRGLYREVISNFEHATAAFATGDRELAEKVVAMKSAISLMEREMRDAHLRRLQMGLKESVETSSIHLDVLANLKRINSYITNTAYTLYSKKTD